LSAAERQARRKALPIEHKESQRWIDMLRRGQELACEVPGTQLICVPTARRTFMSSSD